MKRLAIFDLDHTLIDTAAAYRLFAAEFAAEHGLDEQAERWLLETGAAGVTSREELFLASFERFGLSRSPEDLTADYRRRMPHLVRCEPAVLDGLAALRDDGWRLAIATNGEAGNQQGKIDRTGLGTAVHATVVSGALGIRKPDVGIFRVAAERAGCRLEDGGWMIGDSLVHDIAGGAAAGLRTVWVEGPASGPQPTDEVRPDHVVADVVAAMELLRAS